MRLVTFTSPFQIPLNSTHEFLWPIFLFLLEYLGCHRRSIVLLSDKHSHSNGQTHCCHFHHLHNPHAESSALLAHDGVVLAHRTVDDDQVHVVRSKKNISLLQRFFAPKVIENKFLFFFFFMPLFSLVIPQYLMLMSTVSFRF